MCCNIFILYRTIKPFYIQTFYTDQPQPIGNPFIYLEEIKTANSFYKSKFKKQIHKMKRVLSVLFSVLADDLSYLGRVNLG